MYQINYFHDRVRAEVESWSEGIKADYARIVEIVTDFGPRVGMPHSRSLGGGLFELRPKGKEGIGRVFYCFSGEQRIVVLHALIKKTQQTPEHDLAVARRRMKEVNRG